FAATVCDDGRAVEDDADVCADQIDEHNRQPRQARTMRDHLTTLPHLALVEGRSIDRDEHFSAEMDQLIGRIVRLESFTPERLIIPEIFADGDADLHAIVLEQMPL